MRWVVERMSDESSTDHHRDLKLIGTGRLNPTGGSATMTVPHDVLEQLRYPTDGDADPANVVFFEDSDGGVVLSRADWVSYKKP
jgi:hypothetical protein